MTNTNTVIVWIASHISETARINTLKDTLESCRQLGVMLAGTNVNMLIMYSGSISTKLLHKKFIAYMENFRLTLRTTPTIHFECHKVLYKQIPQLNHIYNLLKFTGDKYSDTSKVILLDDDDILITESIYDVVTNKDIQVSIGSEVIIHNEIKKTIWDWSGTCIQYDIAKYIFGTLFNAAWYETLYFNIALQSIADVIVTTYLSHTYPLSEDNTRDPVRRCNDKSQVLFKQWKLIDQTTDEMMAMVHLEIYKYIKLTTPIQNFCKLLLCNDVPASTTDCILKSLITIPTFNVTANTRLQTKCEYIHTDNNFASITIPNVGRILWKCYDNLKLYSNVIETIQDAITSIMTSTDSNELKLFKLCECMEKFPDERDRIAAPLKSILAPIINTPATYIDDTGVNIITIDTNIFNVILKFIYEIF
jgi:hypothetical protein